MRIEDLKKNIARIEAELAEMKEQLSGQERDWPATVESGMLFKLRVGGGCFMVARTVAGNARLRLIRVDAGNAGNIWAEESLFEGAEEQFTYIGMAKDLLRIEEGGWDD